MYIYQIERDLLRRAIKRLGAELQGKILDVGSGPGVSYRDYLPHAVEIVRLDSNPAYKPDVIGDASSLPLPDESFDSIICTQVLGDVLHPAMAMKEFYRVLRRGGRGLITEGFMNELHSEPQDYWRFTPYALAALAQEAGFKILAQELTGGPMSVTVQLWTRWWIGTLNAYVHPLLGRLCSLFFRLLGALAIGGDAFLSNTASKKIGLNAVVLIEK